MSELNSLKTHIYISSRLSRMFKQRLRNRNFRGVHKGKSKVVNFIKSDQQIDVPAEQPLYLKFNAKTLGNVPRLASVHKQNRSTEGRSKLKSPETRQVQEILVSTLEHMQVPKWDRASENV